MERHDHLRNQFSQRLVAARKRLRNCDARTVPLGWSPWIMSGWPIAKNSCPANADFGILDYPESPPPLPPPPPESASASSWIRCGDELLIWRIPSFHLLFCFFFYYNFHESRSNYADIINKEIRSDLGRSGLDRTTLIIDDSGRVIAVVLNAHLVNNPRDLRRLKRIFACNIDRTRGTRISVRRVSIDIGRN